MRPTTLLGAVTLAVAVLLSTSASSVSAQGYDILEISPPPGYRARRAWLAAHGITLDVRYTGFYQGLAAGTGDEGYDYGDKADVFINLDSKQLFGLREGGGFRSHFEYARDNAPTNLGGAIFATNAALYWPVESPNRVVATSLYFTQKVADRASIAVGKFNPIDLLAADKFYGGWGTDRFMNLIFTAPPSGLIPVVFMGAVATIRTQPVSWVFMVFDPEDRTNDYLPGDLFREGVNVSVSASHDAMLAGRKTTFTLTGLSSTAEGTDYSSIGSTEGTSAKSPSWNVNFEFRHNLQESTEQSTASWGLYVKAAVADGNPNYVKRSLIAGIGGNALFFGRPQDDFGVGAYYYNLSDVLQDVLNPAMVDLDDEAAIEIYYDWTLASWLRMGANVQYVDPATGDNGHALVPALRAQIRF